jgi:hypothetical protein
MGRVFGVHDLTISPHRFQLQRRQRQGTGSSLDPDVGEFEAVAELAVRGRRAEIGVPVGFVVVPQAVEIDGLREGSLTR